MSLVCNPCKIFPDVLNKRLLSYLKENLLLAEEQNGFRNGRSCEDHIFVLSSIIRNNLYANKMVFGCFVDFASAFDFLNRDLLIDALEKIGIEN